jgi:hypothetical protein
MLNLGTIRMARLQLTLDTLQIIADRIERDMRLADFYRRRRRGTGYFLTADEILRKAPFKTTDLLESVPGVRLLTTRGGLTRFPATSRSAGPCLMRLVVDGVPMVLDNIPSIDAIPPASIVGMEVYPGFGFAPVEHGRSPCGVILIWTGTP